MNIRIPLWILAVAAAFLLFGCGGTSTPVTGPADNGSRTAELSIPPVVWPLMAGQTINVGTVTVYNDPSYLHVIYQITAPDYFLTFTAVAVATSLDGIPHNSQGVPQPGHFPYKATHNPPVTYYEYDIPLIWPVGTELYIATHAIIDQIVGGQVITTNTGWAGDHKFPCHNWSKYFHWTVQDGCTFSLPPVEVKVGVKMYMSGLVSYWTDVLSSVPSGYAVTNGPYPAWCLQKGIWVSEDHLYQATLYSSTGPNLPPDVAGYPWGKINWILNHKGTAIVRDIQYAIWYFTGSIGMPIYPGAVALIQDAEANGAGYVPGTGEIIAVVVYIAPNVQASIIEVKYECL
jgi:hypothetical protein